MRSTWKIHRTLMQNFLLIRRTIQRPFCKSTITGVPPRQQRLLLVLVQWALGTLQTPRRSKRTRTVPAPRNRCFFGSRVFCRPQNRWRIQVLCDETLLVKLHLWCGRDSVYRRRTYDWGCCLVRQRRWGSRWVVWGLWVRRIELWVSSLGVDVVRRRNILVLRHAILMWVRWLRHCEGHCSMGVEMSSVFVSWSLWEICAFETTKVFELEDLVVVPAWKFHRRLFFQNSCEAEWMYSNTSQRFNFSNQKANGYKSRRMFISFPGRSRPRGFGMFGWDESRPLYRWQDLSVINGSFNQPLPQLLHDSLSSTSHSLSKWRCCMRWTCTKTLYPSLLSEHKSHKPPEWSLYLSWMLQRASIVWNGRGWMVYATIDILRIRRRASEEIRERRWLNHGQMEVSQRGSEQRSDNFVSYFSTLLLGSKLPVDDECRCIQAVVEQSDISEVRKELKSWIVGYCWFRKSLGVGMSSVPVRQLSVVVVR